MQNVWHPRASAHPRMTMLDVRALRKSFAGPEGARVEVVRSPQFSLGTGEERAVVRDGAITTPGLDGILARHRAAAARIQGVEA